MGCMPSSRRCRRAMQLRRRAPCDHDESHNTRHASAGLHRGDLDVVDDRLRMLPHQAHPAPRSSRPAVSSACGPSSSMCAAHHSMQALCALRTTACRRGSDRLRAREPAAG